jgi:hypothetical protein
MHKHAAFVLPLLLVACGSSRTEPAPSPPPPPDPHAAAVAGLVGGLWAGEISQSPVGPIPFAIEFSREPDGDVHGRAERDGMFLDFRFQKAGETWVLVEDGQIPGVGRQTHTLEPAAPGPAGPRWVTADDPSYVDVAFAVDGDRLVLTAKVHGEPHAVFELLRRGPAAAATAAR